MGHCQVVAAEKDTLFLKQIFNVRHSHGEIVVALNGAGNGFRSIDGTKGYVSWALRRVHLTANWGTGYLVLQNRS